MIRSIRKRLGAVKCKVLDEWPYRGKVRRMPEVRARLRPLIEDLEPLPPLRENLYEIHMLCGARDLDMGIWASWSMMRFMPGCARLFVHSDGTLAETHAEQWRRVVGELVVIGKEQSDLSVDATVAPLAPRLCRWRKSNWASAQLIDVHLFGDAPSLLVMDSDVLVFRDPREVKEALRAPEPRFAWSRDLRSAYPLDPDVITGLTGVRLPGRLCAGFLVSPRLGPDDFTWLEEQVGRLEAGSDFDMGHSWACQTFYALLAGSRRESGEFSAHYSNIAGRTTDERVLRHFVGIPKVRFRYFSEGIPRLLRGQASRPEVS